jgi:ectoine hydroxylase-related dioxygenase (phytanoyl-CoA dioxygenase family)
MSAPSDSQRLFFEAQGYLLLEGVLGQGEVDGLRAACDDAETRFRRNPELAGCRIPEFLEVEAILEYHPAFLRLAEHPAVLPLVRGLLGSDLALLDHSYYVTPPGGVVAGNAWHTDVGSRLHGVYHARSIVMLRVMYTLEDIAADGGATLVLPGSHRFTADIPLPRVEVPEEMPNCVRLVCPAGSAYLFNGNLLHCPGNNRGGTTRRVLLFNYGHRWMRMWKGHEPSAWLAAQAGTPMRRQLLGLGRAYYGPDAPLDEAPAG